MIKFFRSIFSIYSPKFPATLVYMLQNAEYQTRPYLKWFWRTQDFSKVIKRRELVKTKPARLLTLVLQLGMLLEIIGGVLLVYFGHWHGVTGGLAFGIALIVAYPVIWAHLAVVPLELGRKFISKPQQQKQIEASKAIFKNFKGVKIAVAGSYGKTSMKEILLTVLSAGKKVAATPANKNVSISHALFAKKLSGGEEILIIEYGEGAPGDVERFAKITQPSHGVITGLAPAHLDQYKTLRAAGEDIFSLAGFLKNHNVYVNEESPATKDFVRKEFYGYSREGALGWKVNKVKLNLDGTSFVLKKGKKELKLKSGLLGWHQLGPLSLAVALAHELGLKDEEIVKGIAGTKPFEHRMQPYLLNGGWVIDDTYNGNIEGIRAGTELLKELPARRKIYVTPGLVDQGIETEKVHHEMGRLIAAAEPDLVVLMQNSTTNHIKTGLVQAGFQGELKIETEPLEFYNNLKEFLAAGDLVLMQNDWPDNYA